MATSPVVLQEDPVHLSTPDLHSMVYLHRPLELLDDGLDEDTDEDFPLIPCCTALFVLVLGAGLLVTGSMRVYYIKSTSAGVPFWILGGVMIFPFCYYMYKTFRAFRGRNIIENRRLRKQINTRGSSVFVS